MKNPNSRLIRLTTLMLSMMVVLVLSLSAAGQSGNRNQTPPVAGSPKPGDEMRPSSIRERQFRMMQMEREIAQPPLSPEELKLAESAIAEDYKQLQIINNKMMSEAIPAAAPNYAHIAQTLGEIKKKALRLKTNLGLAPLELEEPPKRKYRQAVNADDIKSSLLALDKTIMSFVQNSIFKNPDVVNVEDVTKARRDLESIIRNSQVIGKDADRLQKSSGNVP